MNTTTLGPSYYGREAIDTLLALCARKGILIAAYEYGGTIAVRVDARGQTYYFAGTALRCLWSAITTGLEGGDYLAPEVKIGRAHV